MAGDSDDLAQTATAPSPGGSAPDAKPLGESLGRYRLQRELGAGGMGVVHAAFDPDLERRVALKVLRASDSTEARQRLLREARAMARLAHPNVVTVHEVGSASGRDYVAMELVDGSTLEDWLRGEQRSEDDIVAAFLAAGRGLAAAHAAGLVHRDFKPRNVLRHKDGRIVVTDFGLVVGVETPPGLESTGRLSQAKIAAAAGDTPSSMSGLTATGSLLGTPAYMAPEQWAGGTIGPPADQYAFCVALWEALAGERPFKGDTLEALRAAVEEGPDKLDDTKLPRRLRPVLRRGLARDPAARWPSMNALLAAIAPPRRTRGLVLAIAGAAAIAGIVALALVIRGGASQSACAAPAKDPASVWSPAHAAKLATQPLAVAGIERDLQSWRAVRARACKVADQAVRDPRLACLDGVLARIDVAVQGLTLAGGTRRLGIADQLVDPALCELARPPRLISHATPELVEVAVATIRSSAADERMQTAEAQQLVARSEKDPCAAALARQLAATTRDGVEAQRADFAEAERAAQRCGDERVIAEVAITMVGLTMQSSMNDAQLRDMMKRTEDVVDRVPQSDIKGDLEILRATIAFRGDQLDQAILHAERAMQLYGQRGLTLSEINAGLTTLRYRTMRGRPEDIAMVDDKLVEYRARAEKVVAPGDRFLSTIDQWIAKRVWESGDVAAGHAKLAAATRQLPNDKPVRMSGRVVDARGVPVPGATVVSGPALAGDAVSIAIPDSYARSTTTGPDGRFVLDGVAKDGVVIAQLGQERSRAQTVGDQEVTLTLEPTSRLEGKVDLRGEPAANVTLLIRDQTQSITLNYAGVAAPIRTDGTFTADGVPRGKVVVQIAFQRATAEVLNGEPMVIDKPVVTGIALTVQRSKRVVHIILRSTVGMPVPNGQAVVMPGIVPSSNLEALQMALTSANVKLARPIIGEQAPPAVLAKAKPGDLFATIPDVPEGAASACGVALPQNLDDKLGEDLRTAANRARIAVPCVPLSPTDEVAIVEVPPWPRFD